MPINILLKCSDMESTKCFYQQNLEFDVSETEHETFSAAKEDCTILFTPTDLWPGIPNCTGTIYLLIENVASYYDKVKERVPIVWPLQEMPYGMKEFGIKDCNHYLLAFAQRDDSSKQPDI
ncbi:MAG: hypothetical protein KTR18_14595 [Acidiferrobacterales bacterium]|nr:hypothetical protein [Acidiferrobacterales bacterium]